MYRAIAYATLHETTGRLCPPGKPIGMEETSTEAAVNCIVLWVRYICVNRLAGCDITASTPCGAGGRNLLWALRSAARIMNEIGNAKKNTASAIMSALHPCGPRQRLRLARMPKYKNNGLDAKLSFKLLHEPLPEPFHQHVMHMWSCEVMELSMQVEYEQSGACVTTTPCGGGTKHVLKLLHTHDGGWAALACMRGPPPLLTC